MMGVIVVQDSGEAPVTLCRRSDHYGRAMSLMSITTPADRAETLCRPPVPVLTDLLRICVRTVLLQGDDIGADARSVYQVLLALT